jgi:hypothetical protein
MKDLQQIAFTDLENDKIYLLALTNATYNEFPLDLKIATGAEIKEFILMENACLFDDDDDDILSDNEKLQLIEEDYDVEVYAVAFIIP